MIDRSPLIRMIFLVSVIIIFLIIYSVQISDRTSSITLNKYYKERIFLKQNTRAFSILLHTIRIDSQIISGYSHEFDSIMQFILSDQLLDSSINKKINKNSVISHDCMVCHND